MPTPLDDLKSRVSVLKAEALRLQQGLAAAPPTGTTVWDVVVEEAGAAVGGALASEFLGRSRIGSKTGRALVRQQQVKQRHQAEAIRRLQAHSVLDQLRAQIVASHDHIDEPFRRSMIGAISQAENAHRPDTILRRSTQVMDRVLAYAPRLPNPEERRGPSSDYLLLKRVEETLRGHIVSSLSALTPNWWTERVPDDVRLNAERRREAQAVMWPWYEGQTLPLMHYVDFADYSKIITRRDNWRDTFAGTFGDAELLRAKLRELEPIRNDIAHSRGLSTTASDKLRLYARDVFNVEAR
jgi:hypothetical protein